MAIDYSRVATSDPVLKQVQDEVARSFSNVPDPVTAADGIVRIDTASGTRTYSVKAADVHLVCITNGGPLTVALPSPGTKRLLGVIANGANAVTVQRSDGKTCSFGQSKTLTNAASLFVADGTDWYLE